MTGPDADDDGSPWQPLFSAWTPIAEVEALSLVYQDRAVRDLEAVLDALEPPWTMTPATKARCVAQLGPRLRRTSPTISAAPTRACGPANDRPPAHTAAARREDDTLGSLDSARPATGPAWPTSSHHGPADRAPAPAGGVTR